MKKLMLGLVMAVAVWTAMAGANVGMFDRLVPTAVWTYDGTYLVSTDGWKLKPSMNGSVCKLAFESKSGDAMETGYLDLTGAHSALVSVDAQTFGLMTGFGLGGIGAKASNVYIDGETWLQEIPAGTQCQYDYK